MPPFDKHYEIIKDHIDSYRNYHSTNPEKALELLRELRIKNPGSIASEVMEHFVTNERFKNSNEIKKFLDYYIQNKTLLKTLMIDDLRFIMFSRYSNSHEDFTRRVSAFIKYRTQLLRFLNEKKTLLSEHKYIPVDLDYIEHVVDYDISLLERNGSYYWLFEKYREIEDFNHFIQEYLESNRKRKSIKIDTQIKDGSQDDKIKLYRLDGNYHRVMDVDRINTWKLVYDESKKSKSYFEIEPITDISELDTNNVDNNVKEVISKDTGISIVSFYERGGIDSEQRYSVARQIISTITNLWSIGYIHGHPHPANWTIKYEEGSYRTTLIDFSDLRKIDHSSFIEDLNLTLDTLFTVLYLDYTPKNTSRIKMYLIKSYLRKIMNKNQEMERFIKRKYRHLFRS